MALTLYQTLERIALAFPRYGCASKLDGTADAIALVFQAEIIHHPWGDQLTDDERARVVELNKIDPNGASDRRADRLDTARRAAWEKLRKPRDLRHFVVLVIRDLQEQAHKICRELNLDDGTGLLAPIDEHQAKILEAWDRAGVSPVYVAFARQIERV